MIDAYAKRAAQSLALVYQGVELAFRIVVVAWVYAYFVYRIRRNECADGRKVYVGYKSRVVRYAVQRPVYLFQILGLTASLCRKSYDMSALFRMRSIWPTHASVSSVSVEVMD